MENIYYFLTIFILLILFFVACACGSGYRDYLKSDTYGCRCCLYMCLDRIFSGCEFVQRSHERKAARAREEDQKFEEKVHENTSDVNSKESLGTSDAAAHPSSATSGAILADIHHSTEIPVDQASGDIASTEQRQEEDTKPEKTKSSDVPAQDEPSKAVEQIKFTEKAPVSPGTTSGHTTSSDGAIANVTDSNDDATSGQVSELTDSEQHNQEGGKPRKSESSTTS